MNEIARLSEDLSGIKEKHHDKISRIQTDHRTEISLVNDQHNTRSTRSQKHLMQLMVARDSQIMTIRGELDAMNKRVLDAVKTHALEVKNLQTFHHRILMANGAAGEKVIGGMRHPLPKTM